MREIRPVCKSNYDTKLDSERCLKERGPDKVPRQSREVTGLILRDSSTVHA